MAAGLKAHIFEDANRLQVSCLGVGSGSGTNVGGSFPSKDPLYTLVLKSLLGSPASQRFWCGGFQELERGQGDWG